MPESCGRLPPLFVALVVCLPLSSIRAHAQQTDAGNAQVDTSRTYADVEALESRLAGDPDDSDARWKLLYIYFNWASGVPGPGQPEPSPSLAERGREGRRRHILWFIDHQPGDKLLWAGSTEGRAIIVPRGHASADPVGFDAARTEWLRQIEIHSDDVAVLHNAITFLLLNDKPLTETLLTRAQTDHPNSSWSGALGFLYGVGMLALDGMMGNLGPSGFNPAELNGAFAAKARREVEATSDPVILGTAGYILTWFGGMREATDESKTFNFDHALADNLLSRAVAAQPDERQWKIWLDLLRSIRKQ